MSYVRCPIANINDAKHLPYINKLKIGKYPSSPMTAEDIVEKFEDHQIREKYGKYYKTTVNKNEFAFSIFYSQKMINRMRFLKGHREIMIDATFKVVPKGPYKQLLILYVAYKNNVSFDYGQMIII